MADLLVNFALGTGKFIKKNPTMGLLAGLGAYGMIKSPELAFRAMTK